MDAIIPPHPTSPHPPNHILSMCGDHENRNAYTVVEIRVTKNKNPTQRCGEELMLAEARFCDLGYKIYLQTSKKDI